MNEWINEMHQIPSECISFALLYIFKINNAGSSPHHSGSTPAATHYTGSLFFRSRCFSVLQSNSLHVLRGETPQQRH